MVTLKKRFLSAEQEIKKYKKRFHITFAAMMVLILAFGFYFYLNYDYIAFKHFISHNYIYTEALDAIYEKDFGVNPKGKYFTYFDNLAISAVTKRIQAENNDRYTYMYTPSQYEKTFEAEKSDAEQSYFKEADKTTAYIRITNFSEYTLEFLENQVENLKNYGNLIIDLRDNYGGDLSALHKMSKIFLPKNSVIAVDQHRFMEWTYKAKKGPALKFDRIVILQNRNSASASEGFISALKDNLKDNVILIGETTFGKGIGQFTLPLKRGFAVKATIMKLLTPDGNSIHGKGIKPDLYYAEDDILQFSLKAINSTSGS